MCKSAKDLPGRKFLEALGRSGYVLMQQFPHIADISLLEISCQLHEIMLGPVWLNRAVSLGKAKRQQNRGRPNPDQPCNS